MKRLSTTKSSQETIDAVDALVDSLRGRNFEEGDSALLASIRPMESAWTVIVTRLPLAEVEAMRESLHESGLDIQ